MALNQVWDQDGNLIESIEVPDEVLNPPSDENNLEEQIEDLQSQIESTIPLDDPSRAIFDQLALCIQKLLEK